MPNPDMAAALPSVQNGVVSWAKELSTAVHDTMSPSLTPSLRSFAKSALTGAQLFLGLSSPVVKGGTPVSCSNTQLSCHNTTAVTNLCCFNTPGGQLLQTQFWDTQPVTGPVDSWTLHGLWPDKCDGTYDANCDSSREYSNISAILQSFSKTDVLSYMNTYWKDYQGDDQTFWSHEWNKHGTCINTLIPDCYQDHTPTEEVATYFEKAVNLFKTLPTYEWLSEAGITPSSSKTYTSAQIQSALSAKHGKAVTIKCSSGALDEVWYHYNVQGSLQTGQFVAADPDGTKSDCPTSGVKYLPKGNTGTPTTTTTTSGPTSTPTSSPGVPSGKGYLKISTSGAENGCIISNGKWYTSGTCATYTATASGSDGFTLTSSKGNCGIVDGAFSCGSGVTSTTFTASNGLIAHDSGTATWSADSVASGQTQVTVYASGDHSVQLSVTFQSL